MRKEEFSDKRMTLYIMGEEKPEKNIAVTVVYYFGQVENKL